MFRALGDRVPLWLTINEPWVITDAGYLHGLHAPGHRSLFEPPIASHNLLLSHAAAVEAFRAEGRGEIGIAINLEPKSPASDKPEDLAATRRSDAYMNRQYLDALFLGRYPDEMAEIFGAAWPDHPEDDLQRIRQPIDFLAINYYASAVMQYDPEQIATRAIAVRDTDGLYTQIGWRVHPESLTQVLCWVRQRYGDRPIYITENGMACDDPPPAPGEMVEDTMRVDYLRRHIQAAHIAMQRGVDLRGYFVWSLLDNLEWASGFVPKFGLVHVDFATQKRTLKRSAAFYREVIRTNGSVLEAGAEPGRAGPRS
jgi:beta-glucosidase